MPSRTSATTPSNLTVVKGIVAAFETGDLPGLLHALSPDVEWRVGGPDSVPYAGTRRGREQVKHFFEELSRVVEFQRFEPQTFISEGETVVVLGQEKLLVRAGRQAIENDWVMVFTLRKGQVAAFRQFSDTAALAAGFAGAQHGGR